MGKKRLFLFDGTAIFYRAYYAIDVSLTNSEGEPTNAVFGTSRMLAKFVKETITDEDSAVFAFDRKEKTHRHEMFEDYKATRPEMPDALVSQIKYIPDLVTGFGIKFLWKAGLEADDIIATLSKRFYNDFDEIVIVTGDKDILQLVDDRIKVMRFVTGLTDLDIYDEKKVEQKYGVSPKKMHEFLSMMGDSSDNIPGIRGIGKKTAERLLRKYGTVKNIYENIRQLSPSLRKKLIDGEDALKKSFELVKLVKDAELNVDLEKIEYKGINKDKLRELFLKLEFSSLIKEFDLFSSEKDKESTKNNQDVISSRESEKEFFEVLDKASLISFDIETDSLDPTTAKIAGISFSVEEGKGYYVPLNHITNKWQPDEKEFLSKLKKAFSKSGVKLIGQNLKYDYEVLYAKNIILSKPYFDTMIAAYLLNPDQKRFNLDDLSLKYLGYKMVSFKDLMAKNQVGNDFSKIPVKEAAKYSVEDSEITLRLYKKLSKKIYENELDKVLHEIEMPLIPVLTELEMSGVYMDIERLHELSTKYEKLLKEIRKDLFELAGENFNPNSPNQVGHILFEKLKLTPPKRTSSGNYSTSAGVLESLVSDHPIAQKLLDYRKYQKLKSTYIDALPELVNPKTGRIHAKYNQTGTGTGRLSSSNPNMQNLPIKDAEGKEIRECVVPQKKGWKIISADYSQIELRILAHFSKDDELIRAFRENRDIHSLTASRLYGTMPNSVTNEMRKVGKMVNFAIIYGISPYGLASRLNVTTKEAGNMISNYFSAYPKVREFINNTIKEAKKVGYVKSYFGRRREIPHFRTSNKTRIQEGERIAINAPIQGTAADIMKLAMIKVQDMKNNKKLKSIPTLQVHDELVYEVPKEEVDEMSRILKVGMQEAANLDIPLDVDIKVDDYWN
ncbi:MAG: DNA polymerase I [Kosmotoga sp.]|nr:MAG: DNA polymerase I [Kosmotoga sp.]